MNLYSNLRKRLKTSLFSLLLLLPATLAIAQGAGKAISFPATTANENVNLDTALSGALATANFSLEMWVNFNSFNVDEPIIGNKNWNSGNNIGWVLARSSKQSSTSVNIPSPITTNSLWFNMMPVGGTRRDWHITIPNLNLINNWVHVAITVDRKGTIAFYFNGQPAVIEAYAQSSTNGWQPITNTIAADSNKSISSTYPVRLGQDGTGTYSPRFSGKIDEVRVWNSIRTVTEIRNSMCRKLAGSETGLIACYRLDEASGTAANNLANAGLYAGTLVNTPTRIASAAPIGDTSVNIYATSLSGQSLGLTSANRGNLLAQSLGGSLKGFQIYRVDTIPNTYGTIPNPNNNNAYYGVFPVDTGATPATYSVQYDFTNFPAALTYAAGIDLYGRHSLDSSWATVNATKNITTHLFSATGLSKRKELIIGNFSNPATCNVPTGLSATNVTTNSATLAWTSGGANRWNIEYSAGAFTPGSGTKISNLTASSYLLTGLSSNTTYQFYVQDTCVNLLGTSAWAGPFSFTTGIDYSIYGAGYAMNFQGTSANEHVNLGTALSSAIDSVNFSMEMWLNFDQFNNDETFIANKNWNNGANIGFAWGHSNKTGFPLNTLWFNLQPVGGARRDWHITIPGLNLIKNWNHVAVTINRTGNIAFYINGVPATIVAYSLNGSNSFTTVSLDISSDSTKSIKGTLPVRIGQDGTGTYGVKFKGQMDEVRFWNTIRTQTEIRNYMCRKLPVTTAGLLSYYRLDESTGTAANNMATPTSGSYNGVLTNSPQRVISAAPIGDTSIYAYGTNLTATSLSLPSSYGSLTVDSLINTFSGVQLYRVDTLPNNTKGLSLGNVKAYFGVFPVDSAVATASQFATPAASRYRIGYTYSNYPAAVAAAANLHVYNRAAADVSPWTVLNATNQISTSKLTAGKQISRKEVILSDFTAAGCSIPTNVSLDSLSNTYARLTWLSSGSKWNVQYGPKGFALGTGTTDTVTTPSDVLPNLVGETSYDIYVRTRCTTDSSSWVGPLNFKTLDKCPAPQTLTATAIGADSVKFNWNNTGAAVYNLQWGQQGFTLGSGVPIDNVTGTSYVLSGLSTTQTYDMYIQDTCTGGGFSKWFGPVVFQPNGITPPPPPPSGVVSITGENQLRIYPNPAKDYLMVDAIKAGSNALTEIKIMSVQGVVVRQFNNVNLPYRIDVANLANGVYLMQCIGEGSSSIYRIAIQK